MSRAAHRITTILACALLFAFARSAAADPMLKIPQFDTLADKASESVVITLDSRLLAMAARFLDASDPKDAAVREVISGLKAIYVRKYVFDTDFVYPMADIDGVRKQLAGSNWLKVVEVRKRAERTAVDIYVSQAGDESDGLAIIASEPREFTIVNIVGAIDLDKLHQLEGKFGIPELEEARKTQ